MIGRIKANRTRRAAAVFGAVSALATMALAFFAVTYLGDGSHEGTTGGGSTESLPVNVNFADGLTPSNPVEVTAELENTSGESLRFTNFELTAETPSIPQCGNEWLTFKVEQLEGTSGSALSKWISAIGGEGTEANFIGPLSTGTSSIFDGEVKVYLQFKSGLAGEVDQSACQEVPVIVNGHLE